MSTPKKFVLLGATGSIGTSTLRVLRKHPDKLQLIGVSAHSRARELASIVDEFDVAHAHLNRKIDDMPNFREGTNLTFEAEALDHLAAHPEAEIVVVALVGAAGLRPTLAALEAGKKVVLANKESLVVGGQLITETARRTGGQIIPADSEHNAVFQCTMGQPTNSLDSIILTASGGAFRDLPLGELKNVTLKQALNHPNWLMGPKVTIDSATMANKGLELIEAHWLFGLAPEKLEAVIHPPSIVHAFVRFVDGCCFAQLSPPSMTFALQNSLLHPKRFPGVEPTLDFSDPLDLSFSPPCLDRYPCLKLAQQALQEGGSAPLVFNAANELAVEAFQMNRIGFIQISSIIEHSLSIMESCNPKSLNELLDHDQRVRRLASERINSLSD